MTGVQKTGVEDQSWEYDAAGRVLHFSQGGNHLYYQYDPAGRRTAMTQVVDEDLLTTYYTYRACGSLNSITDPWGNAVSYDYDDLGREIAKALPNGVTTYHNYDAASQVTQVAHLGPNGVLLSFDYTYDTDGRRTKIAREDGTSIYYGYDTVGRLTSEEWLSDSDVGIYSFVYEFDAAGNRSLLTKDGVTTYYSYNTLNQLTLTESTEGALTYTTYQPDGALETKHDTDGWTYYEWDVDEALLRVMRDGTVTGQANELYDAQMKRVARELDGTATYYVFDGEKIARVEEPEAGTRDFYVQEGQSIYSPLVSVHDEAAAAQYWYLFDALGSTMGLVDANGNLSGKLQYDAFGNVLAEEDVPRSAFFKYVGAYQYMPEEFEGMMLLWHRWYDPTVGRFVGRDAVRTERGRSAYRYAFQRPTGLADARGLQFDADRVLRERLEREWEGIRRGLRDAVSSIPLAFLADIAFQYGFIYGYAYGAGAFYSCADGKNHTYTYRCEGIYIGFGAGVAFEPGVVLNIDDPSDFAGGSYVIGGTVGAPLGPGLSGDVGYSPGSGAVTVGAGPSLGAGWDFFHAMRCDYRLVS